MDDIYLLGFIDDFDDLVVAHDFGYYLTKEDAAKNAERINLKFRFNLKPVEVGPAPYAKGPE